MSFEQSHQRSIEAGDTVVIYQGPTSINAIEVSADPKAVFTCKFGTFRHRDMIGIPFGSKLAGAKNKGFVTLLYPTPELWTLALSHRTQILYIADISLITMNLDLKPGSVVIEAGTGSGSFSHSIVRTIAPSGHLHTFEYHLQRVEAAKLEFEKHKIAPMITITHRDVCQEGFGLSNVADAVFLDLPMPWLAIPSAKEAFKKRVVGRICCFSPCIEQVQKNAEALRKNGFCEVQTVEVLLKSYVPNETQYTQPLPPRTLEQDLAENPGKESKPEPFPTKTYVTAKPIREMKGHTSYLTFATLLPPYEELTELPKLEGAEAEAEAEGAAKEEEEEGAEKEGADAEQPAEEGSGERKGKRKEREDDTEASSR